MKKIKSFLSVALMCLGFLAVIDEKEHTVVYTFAEKAVGLLVLTCGYKCFIRVNPEYSETNNSFDIPSGSHQ